MKLQYAIEFEVDHSDEEWPTADQIRKALEEKLRLGDLELEQEIHEVLE
ncbi:hypothetical protein IVB12_15505 [Bradyrhizobium sp. 179]|nr:hypothetical protein [Bradyrhizobium sp. 179]MCK1543321.1 hypothetical protein [Bradyrhizobium sp. 179]